MQALERMMPNHLFPLDFAIRLSHAADLNQYPKNPGERADKLAHQTAIPKQIIFEWLNGIALPKPPYWLDPLRLAYILQVEPTWLNSGKGMPIIGPHPTTGLVSLPLLTPDQVYVYKSSLYSHDGVKDRIVVKNEFFGKDTDLNASMFAMNFNLIQPDGTVHTSYLIIAPEFKAEEGLSVITRTGKEQGILGTLRHLNNQWIIFSPDAKAAYPAFNELLIGSVMGMIKGS